MLLCLLKKYQYFIINIICFQKLSKIFKRELTDSKKNTPHINLSIDKITVASGFGFNLFGVFNRDEPPKTCRYWLIENIADLLDEADKLYYEENYLDVYEMLNRLKYQDNVEVQWRICRVLFKMSQDENTLKLVRDNMIHEAYCIIQKTVALNPNNAEIHKWMAIILDMKSSFDGTLQHVRAAPRIKYHMKKSLELNPNDPTVLYMLGYWCFEMSQLTWIQKQIARTLFDYLPETTCEEAYSYFLKAEQLRPRFYVGNIYMLGLCSYNLGKYYMARYYTKMAAELPVKSDRESMHSENAKKLADKLKNYEISISSLCF